MVLVGYDPSDGKVWYDPIDEKQCEGCCISGVPSCCLDDPAVTAPETLTVYFGDIQPEFSTCGRDLSTCWPASGRSFQMDQSFINYFLNTEFTLNIGSDGCSYSTLITLDTPVTVFNRYYDTNCTNFWKYDQFDRIEITVNVSGSQWIVTGAIYPTTGTSWACGAQYNDKLYFFYGAVDFPDYRNISHYCYSFECDNDSCNLAPAGYVWGSGGYALVYL